MPINVIGITGPSGAGKSLFCNFLNKDNVPMIDADKLYHSMLVSGSPCTAAISKEFGDGVLDEDGCPDRKKLSDIVFSSPEKLIRLNTVVLGFVLDEIRSLISEAEQKGYKNILIDAPTLIESGFHRECNYVVSIIAPKEERIKRICLRDGIDLSRARARVEAQKADEFYIENSDFVLVNDSDIKDFEEKAQKVCAEIVK